MDPTLPHEDTIVSYLLGELTDDEQARLEDRAFGDEQFSREIAAVEDDLIDEYVRGGLSVPRRERFERLFLASAERRKKVAFARALKDVADSAAPAESPARARWWDAVREWIAGNMTPPRLAVAATAVLAVGAAWLVVERGRLLGELAQVAADREAWQRQETELRQRIAAESARRAALATELDEERRRADALAAQPGGVGQDAPSLLALFLPPGISRGSGGQAELRLPPPATPAVRLQLGLETEDDYAAFVVEISTVAGRPVWSAAGLRPAPRRDGRVIEVSLPPGTLDAGRYEVRLRGVSGGRSEDLRFYYFDVRLL